MNIYFSYMNINKRIARLIKELGVTKNNFATTMGEHNSTITNVVNEANKPSYKLIENIISTYNVNPTWLFTGKGALFLDKPSTADEKQPNVAVLENKVAAGFGSLTNPENGLEQFYLPQLDNKPGTYIQIQVEGDSMEPSLYHHDWVIAKKIENITDIIGGHVFVIDSNHGEAYIKRVYLSGDDLELVSDNEQFQTKKLPVDEINSLYRVEFRLTHRLRK